MVGKDPAVNKYKRAKGNIRVRNGRSRRTLVKMFLNASFKLAAIILICFIAREGWIRINRSETFRVKSVKFSGMNRVSRGELEKILKGASGTSIFQINLREYNTCLMSHPWIKKSVIYKILPDTLDVKIEERIPGAVAQLTAGVHLIDMDGVVIKEVDNSESLKLPLMVGLTSGPVGNSGKLKRAMGVISCIKENHQDFFSRLSVIDLSDENKLSLRISGFQGELFVDPENSGRNIINYLAIENLLKRRYESIDYVDLRWNRQIYIKQGIPNG